MGVHTFPKDTSLKVNIIAQLEFELTYYNITVQHISNYAMGTPYQIFNNTEYWPTFPPNQE